MLETNPGLLQSLLNIAPVSRVRRNHGLEHATLHIMSERNPGVALAGHSDTGGFWILGEISTGELESAVQEALQRLREGDAKLAVHPNCGTNLVTSGMLAGVASFAVMAGSGKRFRDKLERLPAAAALATFALMIAQPLGNRLQEKVTTSGAPEALRVVEVQRRNRGRLTAHRIITVG